jgi:isoquinoline 1-oxidoreductase subunit alpha
MIKVTVNGQARTLRSDADTPLLWALRDELKLTGTKFGCGQAQCGACTVHLDGQAIRACITPISSVAGKKITTIEGLSKDNSHPVQRAWTDLQVAQCGYCQSGQIMTASALLAKQPKPSSQEIESAMAGHICRCGTYPRVNAAVKRASELV